jgi:deoxycytidylate deaminase
MKIFQDPIYQLCIHIASASKSKVMKFGAVLTKDNTIIGSGINRHVRKDDIIKTGYANHAEISAINDALSSGESLIGTILYVAGYFPDGKLYIPNIRVYTCKSCVKKLMQYGIGSIAIPNRKGWAYIRLEEAERMAKDINNKTKYISKKRREIALKNASIDMLDLSKF